MLQVALIPNLPGAYCVADWLVSIYSQAPLVFAPLLMTIWATWRNRNSRIWDEECKLATDIVPITLGWWEDYKAARTPSPSVHRSGTLTQWKKPPIGFIKLNVDAAFCLDSGITGLGGVFRDHEGVVLGGFRHTVMVSSSARHAELLALLLGVQLAIDQHLTLVIVETDCMDLVQAISSSSLDQLELGFLIDDLRNLVHAALDAKVVFGNRQVNLVAHTLAQEAKAGQFSIDFFTNIPPSVEVLIFSDCNDASSMN
ncbi:putative ribonuclease H-like domain-containing protein [Rosa chinensis]|uniref:Putative ribonuclease H-like domain-containing protein n=1 Tax=Rosa chinensis TaxID=74649 RepID=A0A2P6QPV1_ROSCH|nr:putative ribonuclease H-like domain-containing protein [Rosa chinensis]